MAKAALIALFAAQSLAPAEDFSACEMQAVAAWNRFATTAKRYTDLRTQGVHALKERERMRREFDAVMRCECF